jgi:hypothetical protein
MDSDGQRGEQICSHRNVEQTFFCISCGLWVYPEELGMLSYPDEPGITFPHMTILEEMSDSAFSPFTKIYILGTMSC